MIPSNVKTIGDQAIGYYYYNSNVYKIEDLTIYGYANTEAQRYANDNGFAFKHPSEAPEGLSASAGVYYLTGTPNGRDHSAEDFALTAHTASDGTEEYKLTAALKSGDEFKIISAKGAWYPDGMNNNYKVAEDGLYNIYFRPNYDGHSDWFNRVMYVTRIGDAPTEAPTSPATIPVTEPATVPATEPATQPATEPATQPATVPATEPVTVPATEPDPEPATQPQSYLLGDADCDDEISILDATAIQRSLAGYTVRSFNRTAVDSDEDGDLTILDATAVQRFLASLPTHVGIDERM